MIKKIFFFFVTLPLLLLHSLVAQELPPKDTVLKQMHQANKYFMDKWPDPGQDIITDKVRPSNIWTRATYYEGMMRFYYIDRDTALYEYAVEWGESHSWEPAYGFIYTRNADNQCCGQTYIELYLLDNQPERIQPIKACIDNMVNSVKSDDWWWVDAIQMAMPVFAKLGTLYNDTSYFRKMFELYNNTRIIQGDSGLYNKTDHLWWRDSTFVPPYETPEGKDCYWSRGNGWVFAALARVLDVLPENAWHRETYVNDFANMAAALLPLQREDGFWNPSLVDPEDYGGKETSGTAFFTFGLAWGINHHFLDEETYKPAVVRAWNGMINDALHPDGFLGYVQGTGKQPSDGQPLSYNKAPNFEDFGLGAFLLAGSEVYHLAPDTASGTETFTSSLQTSDNQYLNIYPNPAKDEFTIDYYLSEKADVLIKLIDTEGKTVKTLKNMPDQPEGRHAILINLSEATGGFISPGIYYIRLIAGQTILTGRLAVAF